MREVLKVVGEGKAPSSGMTSKLQEPLPSLGQAKPARTGAIKPQAVKVEEGKAWKQWTWKSSSSSHPRLPYLPLVNMKLLDQSLSLLTTIMYKGTQA